MLHPKCNFMKASRENFIRFLEDKLTSESAKSYLAYVDAFSRAVQKDENYFFSSTDKAEELRKLLQGDLNKIGSFLKHSPKFQSNIKTGIRALLKYYLHVDNYKIEQEAKAVKIPSDLIGSKITDYYIDKFESWLENFHIKSNGERFRSAKNYSIGLKRAITDLNIDPKEFFSYTRKFQIEMFHVRLESNKNFWDRSESVKREVTSSINKYKYFIAEKNGEKQESLFSV